MSFSVEALDMCKLSLFNDDRQLSSVAYKREGIRWFVRKRRCRCCGSRSLSGRSMATKIDSSREIFVNGEANWSSNVGKAARNPQREGNVDRFIGAIWSCSSHDVVEEQDDLS
ncbi:hypothetical protein ACH5RR_023874 [Cinchona calisaya]|uniref:Uncharacterized protein n=1 Tax=Cinchona calisaya TaxID=153742 RepID=A0ABD2ZBV3_9GENT